MVIRKRLGAATLEVLGAIAAGHPYGFEIMDTTGLAGGTVYPALSALERDGLVGSRWEDPEVARKEKRPPRRYYTITASGHDALRDQLQRLRRLDGALEKAARDAGAAGAKPRKA